MFVFGVKKTQVWVTMALLLLCISICPHWGFPHPAEDEEPAAADEENHNNGDNEEDSEVADEEGESSEDENPQEATGVENDVVSSKNNDKQGGDPWKCMNKGLRCTLTKDCCKGYHCLSHEEGRHHICQVWWVVTDTNTRT